MSEGRESRLRRLAEAVDVYLSHRARPDAERDAVVAEHGALRDLLEPMFAAEGDPAATGRDRVGDFRLLRELGRGGMGVVYEAEEVGLGRRVALKVLPPHVTLSARSIERFRREAAALGRLQHPGIVPIYRVGEVDGTHFYAMELVEGGNLAQAIERQRAIPDPSQRRIGLANAPSYVAEVVEVVAQAAEALAAAHAQGILHRDVKPQNLLMGRDGRVRVADFGLAKDLDRASISHSGEVAGTPHYMSPEQAQGRRELDGRTDVFSLGVVLYELLTLELPFDGDSATGVLAAILTREPVAPRQRNDRIPRDLESICRKALEKDPRDRYATCADFAADLRRFARLEPVLARPPGSVTRMVKLIRRHKVEVVAGVLAFLVIVVAPLVVLSVIRAKDVETAQQRMLLREAADRSRRIVEQQMLRAEQLARQPGMEAVQRQLATEALANLRESHAEGVETVEDVAGVQSLVLAARIQVLLGELERAEATLDVCLRAAMRLGAEPAAVLVRMDVLARRAALAARRGDQVRSAADFAESARLGDDLLAAVGADLRDRVRIEVARTLGAWAAASVRRGVEVALGLQRIERASELWTAAGIDRLEPGAMLDYVEHVRVKCQLHRLKGLSHRTAHILPEALERAERLLAGEPKDGVLRAVVAQILRELGVARSEMRQQAVALPAHVRGLELCEALVRDFPQHNGHRLLLGQALVALARHHGIFREKAAAEPLAARAVGVLAEVAAAEPDSEVVAAEQAEAILLLAEQRVAEAGTPADGPVWEAVCASVDAIAARFPASPRIRTTLANALHQLGVWVSFQEDWPRTRELMTRAVALQRRNFEEAPEVWPYRSWLIFNLRHLFRAHIALNEPDAALALVRETVSLDPEGIDTVGSSSSMLMQIAAAKGLTPQPADGPSQPPTLFDEAVAAVAFVAQRDPARAAGWRRYEPLVPLLVRADYRRILDEADARVTRRK